MKRKHQTGVMLLEVLIALLIFAIGILGLVGMQAIAIKLTADSKYRGEAAMFADQLINQMWADDRSNAALVANYSSGSNGPKYTQWKSEINAATTGLPGATSHPPTVTIDGDNVVMVTIFWKAPDEAATHQHVTVARLN